MMAVLTEALAQRTYDKARLVRWFEQRACERQGIPYDQTSPLHPSPPKAPEATHPPEPIKVEPVKVVVEHQQAEPTQPVQPVRDSLDWWKVLLGALMGAAALALILSLLMLIFGGDDSTTISPSNPHRDSLLQWMEDEGEHIP